LVAVTTTFAPTPRDGGAAVEATSLYRFFRAGDAQTLALQGVSSSASAGQLVVVSGPLDRASVWPASTIPMAASYASMDND
jgi:hypothetical protein